MVITRITFLRLISYQNLDSLLGLVGILGRTGLLQDTVYADMSQILIWRHIMTCVKSAKSGLI